MIRFENETKMPTVTKSQSPVVTKTSGRPKKERVLSNVERQRIYRAAHKKAKPA